MFRKPKRSAKAALRKRGRNNSDQVDEQVSNQNEKQNSSDEDDSVIINSSTKKQTIDKRRKVSDKQQANIISKSGNSVLHEYNSSTSAHPTAKELATRVAEHHPEAAEPQQSVQLNQDTPEVNSDGQKLYTGTKKETNKFHAGPLKAPTFVRTTCRFDYQPDICKDYKDTGFCGFGDTCIYLHDRGDTLSGWQLEKEWEERKKREAAQKEKEMNKFIQSTTSKIETKSGSDEIKDGNPSINNDDGIPYACHICRGPFKDPVVTSCMHYFCERCIMETYKNNSTCPICNKDLQGVFNFPTKLFSKKKRAVGPRGSWDEFYDVLNKRSGNESD